jgi:uroporphyrinogen decarboxylase
MLDQLVEASVHYLAMQARAGADALMLFESWAEGLADDAFERWVIQPTTKLVKGLRAMGVKQPIIGFPRGAGGLILDFAEKTGVSAVGLDTSVPLAHLSATLPANMPVQGNLDPMRLVAGGPGLDTRVREIVDALRNRPHVFNLGHGVVPETPIAHVEQVLRTIRSMA